MTKKTKISFKCSKCKKEVEELIQYGGYNGHKCEEEKWYCDECFKKIEAKNE